MSNVINLFELASRKRFRYDAQRGQVNTEDLWDLALVEVNKIAVAIHTKLQADSSVTFLRENGRVPAGVDKEVESAKLAILQHVIRVREDERDEHRAYQERLERKRRLSELLAQKDEEAFVAMSREDILAEINKL